MITDKYITEVSKEDLSFLESGVFVCWTPHWHEDRNHPWRCFNIWHNELATRKHKHPIRQYTAVTHGSAKIIAIIEESNHPHIVALVYQRDALVPRALMAKLLKRIAEHKKPKPCVPHQALMSFVYVRKTFLPMFTTIRSKLRTINLRLRANRQLQLATIVCNNW